MLTNYEAIKLLIEEEVSCDIHGDPWGHERVAEHLAAQIDALEEKIAFLEDKLAKCEQQRANASWAEDYRRGMSF